MKILAIDTSCDETSAAVTENLHILSNIVWSQASQHARWGGVFPSLAQRLHREKIDWTIDQALKRAKTNIQNIDAVAVTQGPGLAIALEVGITKAKELSVKYQKPLIAVNHLEAHILSPLAGGKTKIDYPALGLIISGGHTDLVLINKIGKYHPLATTSDDALGEALDKAARMLGLGYPGGAVLESLAKQGNPDLYPLPIPMLGREKKNTFSYSGLKTAMYRLVDKEKPLTKNKINHLAAGFQKTAFIHLSRVIAYAVRNSPVKVHRLLVGGGVANNLAVRTQLRKLGKRFGIEVILPYSKKLCGDNAAMVGVTAFLKGKKEWLNDPTKIDRKPRMEI